MEDALFPIKGDSRYAVTKTGRVFRLERVGRWPPGECKPNLSKRGYTRVCIDGKLRNVHQLVALNFIPNPENKPEVAHGDGDKRNNHVANLRWATRKENNSDMAVHGTLMFGEKHTTRKLSLDEVRKIQQLACGKPFGAPPLQREIAAMFNVSRECVSRLANKQRWIRATAP